METTFKKEGRIDVETLITLHHLLPTDLEEDLVELLEENNPLRRKSIDCQNLYRFCGFVSLNIQYVSSFVDAYVRP